MIILVKIFTITLAWVFVHSSNHRDKLFFLQKSSGEDNETLLVVTWTESADEISAGCEIFKDEDLINEVLESSNDSPIRTLSEDEMQNMLEDCTEFSLRRRRREIEVEDEEDEYDDNEMTSDLILNVPSEARNNRRRPTSNGGRTRRRQNGTGENARARSVTTTVSSRRRRRRKTTDSPITTTLSNSIETTIVQNGQRSRRRPNRTDVTSGASRINNSPITTTLSNIIETTTDPPTTLGYDGLPVIYPGTKWCGAGAIAKNYDDLGPYDDTDRCCRAHDLCNDTLAPGETRNNLTNTSPFTKLCCECDVAFYNCLSRVNSFTSNTIGNLYFNVLRRDCYKKEYPETSKCKTYRTLLKITCLEYERNIRAPKVLQWIPPERYKNIPVPGPLKVSLK